MSAIGGKPDSLAHLSECVHLGAFAGDLMQQIRQSGIRAIGLDQRRLSVLAGSVALPALEPHHRGGVLGKAERSIGHGVMLLAGAGGHQPPGLSPPLPPPPHTPYSTILLFKSLGPLIYSSLLFGRVVHARSEGCDRSEKQQCLEQFSPTKHRLVPSNAAQMRLKLCHEIQHIRVI